MSDTQSPFSARIVTALSPDLGPHTAAQALSLVCQRARKTPASLSPEDLDIVNEVLGRMLRTLLGRTRSERVLGWIAWDLSSF